VQQALSFYELFVPAKHDDAIARGGGETNRARVQRPVPTTSTMASASMSSSPITQVSQHQVPIQSNLQPQLLTRLLLDLRGRRFSVDRETIMNLPESVLLCLFPNGLVLSRQSAAFTDGGDNEEDEEVYAVDVRFLMGTPPCEHSSWLNYYGYSSIQSALHMSWISSEMRRTRFMALQAPPACLPRSNISWMGPPLTLVLPPLRIHS